MRSHDVAQRWVCFIVGQQSYGLPILRVVEVLRVGSIEPVPGAPAMVVGVINLRGQVLTVLDPRRQLGIAGSAPITGPETRIVIMDNGEEVIGLLVDRVADVRKLPDALIQPAPTVHQLPADVRLLGVVNDSNGFLILLDPDSLTRS